MTYEGNNQLILRIRHTDAAGGLDCKEARWTCNRCRLYTSDNMGRSYVNKYVYAQISAQSNRHEGSGPLAKSTYARNGLDNSEWKNVG
eukprot:4973387-Heterocapsa_arctica.AAC.1